MASELLTVEEAASRLKMNPQTVRRWIRRGLLPAAKVGPKQWRISAADVDLRMAEATPTEMKRRTEAVEQILALRERLRGRGISVKRLIAESRRELGGRGG
jgi:excisionase family DNA binding protein